MTRVDFYLLQNDNRNTCPLFACRLTEKAVKQGHHVFINTDSDRQLRQMDDLLWSFRGGSFLPHAIYADQADTIEPVLLGHAAEPGACNDVLINLSTEVPAWFGRFDRVVELIDGDATRRAAARQRYAFYKDRGYTLNTHEIET
ncbi:MAG: DNA polymerase III subunit chi [Pseudomonadota bacterium]